MPISHYQKDFGVCLSLPAVVGRNGIKASMEPLLNDNEKALLAQSAQSLKAVLDQCEQLY